MQYLIGICVLGIFIVISYFVFKRKRKDNVDEILKSQLKPVILDSSDLETFIKRFGGGNVQK